MTKPCFKSLFVLLSGMMFQVAYAAAPTESAPTPQHDAADVVSLFSDHYETVGKGPEPQTWGGDNKITVNTISGTNDQILTTAGNSYVCYTSNWTGQTKGYIHMDIWAETAGTFSFGLGVSFGGSLTFLNDYNWPTLKAGQWNSIDVPMVEFVKAGLNDANNLQAIRFSGKGTYHIDNIYAWGDKEEYVEGVDIPVAPVPTHNEAEVVSAFSDTYKRATKAEPLAVTYAGNTVAKLQPYASNMEDSVMVLENLSTSGINISIWNISTCNYIHMDVYWTGETGTGEFEFGLNSADWGGKDFKYLSNFNWPQTIAGQWVSMEVPIVEFSTISNLKLNGIIMMQFKGSGTFYVDNIYAYQTAVEVSAPQTVPTFTLDAANVLSIFCEQYEEEGYQDSELGMTDVDANGNLMYYGQNQNQDREFVEIVEGNQTIHLTEWNDYPFKIHKNSTSMDLSGMDYLHASVYLMSELDFTNKPATVTFWMHDKAGNKVDSPTAVPYITLQRGQWVSFSIPLCHYKDLVDLSDAYVLRLRVGGYPGMEIYLDNVFAYKGEPIGLVADGCEEEEGPCEPIFDKADGTLPNVRQPFLGVNLSSASGGTVPGVLGTNYAMPKMEDLWYFNAKGVKLIRFPFRWKRVQSEVNGPLVQKDIDAMKEVVAEAERLGIWVMLDMHDYAEYTRNDTLFTIDGRYRTKNANGYWTNWKTTPEGTGVTKKEFADVWVKLATEFKEFSNIYGYDLMNEPKDVDLEGLRDCYQYVIDEIRKVDTKAAIVVEGKNYTGAAGWPNNAAGLETLTDPIGNNIIYQAHCYFDDDSSGTYGDDYDTEVGDNFDVYKERLDPFVNWLKEKNKRGLLGEFGVPYSGAKQSDERYMVLIDSVFSYLKQHQLTSTIWCAGHFYESNHLSVSPDKDYCTEKSTMEIMEKYITNFHEDWKEETALKPVGDDKQDLHVYPNPVTGTLLVQMPANGTNIMHLYNAYGQKIYETVNDMPKCEIDFSSYAAGLYVLLCENENSSTRTACRILKQ